MCVTQIIKTQLRILMFKLMIRKAKWQGTDSCLYLTLKWLTASTDPQTETRYEI